MVEVNYKVKPISKPPSLNDDIDPRVPGRYSASALIGRRMSGKTVVLTHLIEHFYKDSYSQIMVLSPTAFLDHNWKSIAKYKNVLFFDKCTNAILKKIMKVQEERASKGKDLLLIVDDFGVNRALSNMIDIIGARGRHYRLQFIMTAQYLRNLSPVLRNNLDYLLIWRLTEKEFKKVAEDVPSVAEDEFLMIAKEATKEPFEFLKLNLRESGDAMFSFGF